MTDHLVRRFGGAGALTVVVAPDSFKGTIDAASAGDRIAAGWRAVRPADHLALIPMADGGEGTLDVLAATGAVVRRMTVCGPDGHPVESSWALLADGTAVIELALACGLPLMDPPDALGATTFGLGQLLAAACRDPEVERILVALGGSATTDGGAGALRALGAELTDASGSTLPRGGGALPDLARVDLSRLVPPPPAGVTCLADVNAPLLGPLGAAAQFGPQKGASPADVFRLEQGLTRWSGLLGGEPSADGMGAAGGTAYALATAWEARLTPGAPAIGELNGFHRALKEADLVLTGEGRFDAQSLRGKVVGHVLDRAGAIGVPVGIIAGQGDATSVPTDSSLIQLADLAGSVAGAISDPGHWLEAAGRIAATRLTNDLEETIRD